MHPEDDERRDRAHVMHQNPVLPVVWCSTDGGINYDCPRCRGPLHGWVRPVPEGKHWFQCHGCGAFWDDKDGAKVSSLGPCKHTVQSAQVRPADEWVVIRALPEDHGFDGEARLIRYGCLCGAMQFKPAPSWDAE
jgi:hypothetical protein